MNRNCLNCGAAIDYEKHKCPYCGTNYFDMSCIDLVDGEPFFLQFKSKVNGQNCYVTQLVIPKVTNVTTQSENAYAENNDKKLLAITTNKSIMTNIEFTAIPMKDNSLMILEIEKEQE